MLTANASTPRPVKPPRAYSTTLSLGEASMRVFLPKRPIPGVDRLRRGRTEGALNRLARRDTAFPVLPADRQGDARRRGSRLPPADAPCRARAPGRGRPVELPPGRLAGA